MPALTVVCGMMKRTTVNKEIIVIEDENVRLETIRNFIHRQYGPLVNVSYYNRVPKNFHSYDVLFLDHDLGDQGDVYDILRKYDLSYFEGDVVIHSMNPVGARNLAALFPNANVSIIPYSKILSLVK